ncbi:MAG: tetratricopeptide repeat protein, partial [Saprospiraceae bacterium]|nr:tetratricopeptide repeat protein [Saprospiraceae bacterium]
MADKQTLDAIKKRLTEGELEAAYTELARWLEQSPEYAELARIVRINQAELYQVKAEVLKGVLSNEEARRAYNQLTDKALQVIGLIEAGRTSLSASPVEAPSGRWRYYLVGGLVALLATAVGAWFYWQAAEDCPGFNDTVRVRVLILPFMGASKEYDPAIDIMDELNDWIERSPQLRAEALAAVHRRFDIEKNYPNSADAVALARACDVQMVVWGKVRQRPDGSRALDVRYRLIGTGQSTTTSDTTLSRLLATTEEAALTSEPPAIARMLYIALSNFRRVPVLAAALRALQDDVAALTSADKDTQAPIDTTTAFLLADHYIQSNQPEKAIAEYNKVLEHYPNSPTAHLKRGALLLQTAQYEAAARDLEAVPPLDTTLLPALRQARIEAFLKSSQPEKARKEIEQARREGAIPAEHLEERNRQVRDSIAALEVRRDQLERKAAQTQDPKLRLGAARVNLALGNPDRAAQQASAVLRQNPRNTEAIKVAVEAEIQRGDTAQAIQI